MYWHAGMILAFALGMATKRAMLVAPLLVLMYDGMFLSATWRDPFARRKLLYACFLPILVWGCWEPIVLLRDSLAESGAISRPVLLSLPPASENDTPAKIAIPAPSATGQRNIAGFGYQGISSWDYFRSQPAVVLHYLKLSLWPNELCIDYWWPVAESSFSQVMSLGLVLFALVASLHAYWRRRAWGFLGLAFFVHLAPRSSFIPRYDLAVEHRMYLPLACVLALVVIGGERLLRKLARRAKWSPRTFVGCSAALVAVAALGLMARTINRNQDYYSAQSLWQNTVRVSPHNPRAHYNLGVAFEADGNIPLACKHYRQSLAHAPDFMEAHANLGQWLIELGETEEGLKHLQQAAELAPEVALVQANYAARLLSLGRLEEAEIFAQRVANLAPGDAVAWERLGTIDFRQGQLPEATLHFQKSLALEPHRLSASLQLADIQMQRRDVASAMQTYQEIVKRHPECAEAHRGLANTFAAIGKSSEAQPHYLAACRIAPEDVANHVDWGRACFLGKEYPEAVMHFTNALNLKPRDPELQIHLASALAETGRTAEAVAMYRQALPQLPPESPLTAHIQAWLSRQATVPTKAGVSRN
jgi:tetratricopeptide (TPR) repeat protein